MDGLSVGVSMSGGKLAYIGAGGVAFMVGVCGCVHSLGLAGWPPIFYGVAGLAAFALNVFAAFKEES